MKGVHRDKGFVHFLSQELKHIQKCFQWVYCPYDNLRATHSELSFVAFQKTTQRLLDEDYRQTLCKNKCVGFLWRLCESFDTRVHCDLAPPVEATSKGIAGANFKTLQGSILTGWLNAESELGDFLFFLQEKDRKGRVCERQSVSHLSGNSTVTWKRVSITCVKSYYMRLKWQIMLSVGLSMSLHAGSPPMKGSDKSQNEWLTTEQDVSK